MERKYEKAELTNFKLLCKYVWYFRNQLGVCSSVIFIFNYYLTSFKIKKTNIIAVSDNLNFRNFELLKFPFYKVSNVFKCEKVRQHFYSNELNFLKNVIDTGVPEKFKFIFLSTFNNKLWHHFSAFLGMHFKLLLLLNLTSSTYLHKLSSLRLW